MRRMGLAVLILTTLLGTRAWAAEGDAYYDANGRTVHDAGDMRPPGTLRDEVIGIKPQMGVLSYNDGTGTTSRFALGLTLDWNVAALLGEQGKAFFIGPSTGLIYSHTGATGASFVGTNPGDGFGGSGGNMFLIPLNLKAGVNLTDNFRISAHGGANLINRTFAASVPISDTNNPGDSDWSIFPNIGADLELGLGHNIALIVRPDFTLTTGNDLFTGTVGVTIPLG